MLPIRKMITVLVQSKILPDNQIHFKHQSNVSGVNRSTNQPKGLDTVVTMTQRDFVSSACIQETQVCFSSYSRSKDLMEGQYTWVSVPQTGLQEISR